MRAMPVDLGYIVVLALKKTFRLPYKTFKEDPENISEFVLQDRLEFLLKKIELSENKYSYHYDKSLTKEEWKDFYDIDISGLENQYYIMMRGGTFNPGEDTEKYLSFEPIYSRFRNTYNRRQLYDLELLLLCSDFEGGYFPFSRQQIEVKKGSSLDTNHEKSRIVHKKRRKKPKSLHFVTLRNKQKKIYFNKVLRLKNRKIESLTEINGFEKLRTLKVLDLEGNRLRDLKGIKILKNLKELYVSNNSLTEVKELQDLPHLQALDLSYNKIQDISGLEYLRKLKELKIPFIWNINAIIKSIDHIKENYNSVIVKKPKELLKALRKV